MFSLYTTVVATTASNTGYARVATENQTPYASEPEYQTIAVESNSDGATCPGARDLKYSWATSSVVARENHEVMVGWLLAQ